MYPPSSSPSRPGSRDSYDYTSQTYHHHNHTMSISSGYTPSEKKILPMVHGHELDDLNRSKSTLDSPSNPRLFDATGRIVLQPAPSAHPQDPLNMTPSRKAMAVTFLAIFGALVSSAELILGAMLPVFALVYGHIDVKVLKNISDAGGLPAGGDPLKFLSTLPGAPPILQIYLLASAPVLVIGLSNLVLIPLAIAVGRRPVILGAGIIGIAGAVWAGSSQSLHSHIAARCMQAIGAGTIESLIPFIVQDMVFVHQRNTWMAIIFAAQGILIILLGIATPHVIIYLDWRYVYYITAAASAVFLILVFFTLPETRWSRTKAELDGIPAEYHGTPPAKAPFVTTLSIVPSSCDWHKGLRAFLDAIKTFVYPHIFLVTMLNSTMIAATFAAGYTVAPVLLTKPFSWPFLNLGLCLIPILIAAILAGIITGTLADYVTNAMARRVGYRKPENQLLNMILPVTCSLVGCVLYGIVGQNISSYHWSVFLFGLGLMAFGFLGANTIGAVYVLESYPHLAGPALVNIASFRGILAFLLSFKISDWVADYGYLKSFMIYTGLIGFFALLTPVVYFFGPAWRRRWDGGKGSASA